MTLLKGALVSYTPAFLSSTPNITLFQYNPESLTHTWIQFYGPAAVGTAGTESGNPYSVPGMPDEEFSLTIILDSNEDIADNVSNSAQLAQQYGIYTRLAALEMLLYPVTAGAASQLLGQTSAALGLGPPPSATAASSTTTAPGQPPASTASSSTGSGGGQPSTAPSSTVPVVLFVWGPYRVVPVRVIALTIVEMLYDTNLNPVHAEASLTLRVLTPAELAAADPSNQALASLATSAYQYTLGVRANNAQANAGNAPTSLAAIV